MIPPPPCPSLSVSTPSHSVFHPFQIVKERIHSHLARTGYVWNNVPGALAVQTDYTHVLSQLPFYYKQIGKYIHRLLGLDCQGWTAT